MDKNTRALKIFLFSQPLLTTEWPALMGNKYARALSFPWEFTDSIENADVIAWDGVVSEKMKLYQDNIIDRLKSGAVLLLQGDARTLFENHPFVSLITLDQLRYVELSGWSVLPEELLAALVSCHQKMMNHV